MLKIQYTAPVSMPQTDGIYWQKDGIDHKCVEKNPHIKTDVLLASGTVNLNPSNI